VFQVVFLVMMVIKGMSYALLNPTKEILYQVCTLSWITLRGFFCALSSCQWVTNAQAVNLCLVHGLFY
jgi:hypothetical protein